MPPVADIADLVKNLERLPTLPGIAMRILETVARPDADMAEIAGIIATDPPLSAEVLKIVNSPIYGLATKVTSVQRAVTVLGMTAVKNLALSFSIIRANRKAKGDPFDYTLFWKNSLIAAVACRLLASRIAPQLAEDAFFLGLLHNIGILCLVRCMPDQYRLVLKEMERSGCDSHEAETQVLGFTHMEVGQHLVRSWGLSEIFDLPIGCHHHPEQTQGTPEPIGKLTVLLHLASAFIDFFQRPDKTIGLGLIDHHIHRHGLAGMFDVDEVIGRIDAQTKAVFPLFEIKVKAKQDYAAIIEKARSELIAVSADFMQRFLEQQQQIEKLRELATRDGLTGLLNYQRLHETIEQELARSQRYGQPFSLIIADIDHFKRINDTYGHPAGDHVLKETAALITASLRRSDMAARYGGEEFAVVMPATRMDGAMVVAERLRQKLAQTRFGYEGRSIFITLSQGIASFDPVQNNLSRMELIKQADAAVYAAKNGGRNRVCVN